MRACPKESPVEAQAENPHQVSTQSGNDDEHWYELCNEERGTGLVPWYSLGESARGSCKPFAARPLIRSHHPRLPALPPHLLITAVMEPSAKPSLLSDSEPPPPYHPHPPSIMPDYFELEHASDDVHLEEQPLNGRRSLDSNSRARQRRMTPVARAHTTWYLAVVGTIVCGGFIASFFVHRHGQLLYLTPPGSFLRAIVFSSFHVSIILGTRFLVFQLQYEEYQIVIVSTTSIILAIVSRLLDLAIDGELYRSHETHECITSLF